MPSTFPRSFRAALVALSLALLPIGCIPEAQQNPVAPLSAGGMHVLFIGNSLTYVNDLPATVAALALTTGDTIKTLTVAFPDYALVDHLREGSATRAILMGGWSYVVLQQGPSSVQVNRDSLITLTQIFDRQIRTVGATPALYSVWPQTVNYSTFDRAIESYRLAAASVNGMYLPVGLAWQAALAANATLPLYDSDGLHASPLGTYLAALVLYERFTGKDPRNLSKTAVVAGQALSYDAATVMALQQFAHDATAKATKGLD